MNTSTSTNTSRNTHKESNGDDNNNNNNSMNDHSMSFHQIYDDDDDDVDDEFPDNDDTADFLDATLQDLSNDNDQLFDDNDSNNMNMDTSTGNTNNHSHSNNHIGTTQKSNILNLSAISTKIKSKSSKSSKSSKKKSKSSKNKNHNMNNSSNHSFMSNSSIHSNDNNSLQNNSMHSMNDHHNIHNLHSNKSTDDCLDALLDDDDDNLRITNEEAEFFNSRKIQLKKQLEEERRRSQEEMKRLADDIQSGNKTDYKNGNGDLEGSGVGIGKVNDYIGKIGKVHVGTGSTAFDSVALAADYGMSHDDNDVDDDDASNGNDIDNKDVNANQDNEIRDTISPLKADTFDDINHDGLSIDDEDNDDEDNINDDDDLDDDDIEFCPTGTFSTDNDDGIITAQEKASSESASATSPKSTPTTPASTHSPSKRARDKVTIMQENYRAQQIAQQNEENKLLNDDTNDDDNENDSNNDDNTNDDDENSLNTSLLYNHLKSGFDYIKNSQSKSPTKTKTNEKENTYIKGFNQCPIIHFVDPTSQIEKDPKDVISETTSPAVRKAWNRTKSKSTFRSLNIYNKLNTVLQVRHNSSLKSIRYKHLRTNSLEMIDNIPIQPQLITEFISDPADWHKGPLCHVYIAACASLEHYRRKVRPFLKAFVSQIDGAGSGNKDEVSSAAKHAMKKEFHHKDKAKEKARIIKKEQVASASLAAAKAKDAAGSSASSKYMIIYVPIHPSCVVMESSRKQAEDGNRGGGLGFRKRFAAAAGRRNKDDGPSLKAGNSSDWSVDDDVSVLGENHQLNPSIVRQLSKEQTELYSKFCNDFPNGRTCLLSSLLDKDNKLATQSQLLKQEMHEVLQTLGKVMISGFTDRVQCYNHEIRKCQEDEFGAANEDFDWCRYFLVKESLALTYEQLQLPLEALQEYEELEAKLPTIAWPDENDTTNQYQQLSRAAAIGDTEVFREALRSAKEIGHLSSFSLKYLFARQSRLLFLQKQPVALIDRFAKHVRKVYFLRCNQCEKADKEHRLGGMARIEAWVIGACWDLKAAIESFLSFNLNSCENVSGISQEERESISKLVDILNFARMRLYHFGDIIYTKNNIVHRAHYGRPKDSSKPWVPWRDLSKGIGQNIQEYQEIKGKPEILADLGEDKQIFASWVEKAMKSSHEYENVFIEVSDIIIRLNKSVDRMRCAARLSSEQAECHIMRNEFDKATLKLLPTIDLSMSEPWDALLSWRLFRLISCQRISGSPAEYLRSLTSCFGPRSAASMPTKLINLLINDLEDVVKSPEVAGHTWGLSPLLETNVFIKPTSGGEIVESSNILRKRVIKNVCFVGDEVFTELHVTSDIPRAITVDEVKVTLIKLEDYTLQQKSGVSVDSTTCVLNVGRSVHIQPGDNIFKLPWTVMTVGQYVVSSVEIQWNNAYFMQDYCVASRPALCVDVLPNEPTQSIELNPIFLIPGHVQNVRLFFYAGSDIVRGGLVELFCSQGLKVLEPGTDVESGEWKSKCRFDLDPCQPGEKIAIIVTVQSDAIETYHANESLHDGSVGNSVLSQTLEAIVTTSYHHKLYEQLLESGKMTECSPMSAILQANVTTLERPALTISNSNANMYDDNLAVISTTVHCNTPVPFSLKEWNITFPSPLYLQDGGDLNKDLFNRSIVEGEELFFGFKCFLNFSVESSIKNERPLLNVVLQDHFGKTFLQVLPLDLDVFYNQVIRDSNRVNSNAAVAKYSLSSQEGLVGLPVSFTCDIDCKHLMESKTSDLLYSLSCDDGDWIIGGKVRGVLSYCREKRSCTLEFVGIPTRSGLIKSFPNIEIMYSSSISSDVKVTLKYPLSFLSLAHKSIETFAYLSLHEF